MDLNVFRRICYKAADRTGGKVTEFRFSDGVTPNFHQGIITFRDRSPVAVVLSRNAAVVAVAAPRVIDFAQSPALDSSYLTFIDFPDMTDALNDTRTFPVLTSTDLEGPFDAAKWTGISSYDVHSWKPATLGQALFNYWD